MRRLRAKAKEKERVPDRMTADVMVEGSGETRDSTDLPQKMTGLRGT